MSDLYINSINCVILVVALALIILIYVVFIGLYCLMGGCGVMSIVLRLVSWFTSRPVKLVLQALAYLCITFTLCFDPDDEQVNIDNVQGTLNTALHHAASYSNVLSVLGLVYLVHSACSTLRWFLGSRYPTLCFSPSELKTFINRIQASEPICNIKVTGGQMFSPFGTTVTKDFVPHLWTDFIESIDVVGARKNRIESAISISDVLEELLQKNKVFIMDIGIDLLPEDNLSSRNTKRFASKVLDTASTKFPNTSSASFNVMIPAISSRKKVKTNIALEAGSMTTGPENELLKLKGPRLTAIIHRELDLPAFWYFMWKYKEVVMVISTLVPPLGLFFQYLLERSSQRHSLDLSIKYSFVPQTDPPYQLDKTVQDIDFAEPQKVTILLPSERFLVPRDSLSRIITGEVDWRQHGRNIQRTSSTESSPPNLTPHASNMAVLLERAEEYRRSRNSSSEECCPLTDGVEGPPSYTAVFTKETEGVTPPPDYSKIKSQESSGSLKRFF